MKPQPKIEVLVPAPVTNVSVQSEILTRREKVWLTAWVETASASNCTDSKAATGWADKCLADFDMRFSPK